MCELLSAVFLHKQREYNSAWNAFKRDFEARKEDAYSFEEKCYHKAKGSSEVLAEGDIKSGEFSFLRGKK